MSDPYDHGRGYSGHKQARQSSRKESDVMSCGPLIESLEAEIAQLKAEKSSMAHVWKHETDKRKARVAELEAALQSLYDVEDADPHVQKLSWCEAMTKARAALKIKEEAEAALPLEELRDRHNEDVRRIDEELKKHGVDIKKVWSDLRLRIAAKSSLDHTHHGEGDATTLITVRTDTEGEAEMSPPFTLLGTARITTGPAIEPMPAKGA